MAVIINELEVVLETPAQKPAAAPPPPPPAGAQQQLQPLDIDNIREREARAAYRLLAH